MFDTQFYLVMASSGLLALGMVTAAGLTGWRGWLTLKQQELALGNGAQREPEATGNAGARIEIADLKERIRKLEAIAAGVDL